MNARKTAIIGAFALGALVVPAPYRGTSEDVKTVMYRGKCGDYNVAIWDKARGDRIEETDVVMQAYNLDQKVEIITGTLKQHDHGDGVIHSGAVTDDLIARNRDGTSCYARSLTVADTIPLCKREDTEKYTLWMKMASRSLRDRHAR